MMGRALDTYDILPEAMRRYISFYGFHFSKKAFEYASSGMKRINQSTGKMEKITPMENEKVDELLRQHGVTLENDTLYDKAYVMHMGRCDYLYSSVIDEAHLARYVKDVLDDPDGCDELPFRYWLQKMVALGTPVDWDELI